MASLTKAHQNKDGSLTFYIRIYQGTSDDGTQVKHFEDKFRGEATWTKEYTRKKAVAYANSLEKSYKDGSVSAERITFKEFCDNYLQYAASTNRMKPKTIDTYKQLTGRIYARLGNTQVRKITPSLLSSFYSELISLKKPSGDRQLSDHTISHYHRFISSVLKQAVYEGIIPFNPADRIPSPKYAKPEQDAMSREELIQFLESVDAEYQLNPNQNRKWRMFIYLLAFTGARIGEILGLKWDAIDTDNKQIHIFRTVEHLNYTGTIIQETPKTKSSDRYIPLNDTVNDMLIEYRKINASAMKLQFGSYFKDSGFLFMQDDGSVMHPQSPKNFIDRLVKKYNLHPVHPHTFRHTLGSLSANNGVDILSIQSMLGHSRASTTMDLYCHADESASKRTADKMTELILKQA